LIHIAKYLRVRMEGLRIVFFGTPDFAVASLDALLGTTHEVVAVVTAPDKPSGRGQQERASPVKECALQHGIQVLQPTNLKSEDFMEALQKCHADIQVVVAFRMLPEVVWDMPVLGTYNVHGSLLPDYRGAAPINWAIINGERETGVTSFKLQHEIDTGNLLLQQSTPIGPNENAGDVYMRLMDLGAKLLVESIELIASGTAKLTPQPDQVSKHAPKIQKEDCKINWNLPAQQVHDFIRGMNPFPGAFTLVKNEDGLEPWKIGQTKMTSLFSNAPGQFRTEGSQLFIGTGDKELEILLIQPPGKKKLSAVEFLNGYRGTVSSLLCQ